MPSEVQDSSTYSVFTKTFFWATRDSSVAAVIYVTLVNYLSNTRQIDTSSASVSLPIRMKAILLERQILSCALRYINTKLELFQLRSMKLL